MESPPAQSPDADNRTATFPAPPPAPLPAQAVPVSGGTLRALHAALLDAFDLPTLRQLFLFELNRPLDATVAVEGRTLDAVVTDAVRWALGAPGVGLHGLLDAARRANPAHPGLAQLAQEWRDAVFVRPACPYPGMRPFTQEEAGRFFGRAQEVQRALAALRLHPVLCVIGPSGSGKSSLAFAGIVPALRASTLFGGARWTVAALRPGADPARALDAALEGAGTAGMESRPTAEARLLLVVDQAEELFTLAEGDARRAFEDALLRLAAQPAVAVLLTVRSDYYTDLLTSRLWPLLRERLLDVAPLRGDALRDAIVHPAADVGVTVDPALAERLLADAGDEAGVLPFIQETMVLLWDQAGATGGFTLALDAYAAAVGARTGESALQVALGGRADAAYLALDERGQRLARRTFLRLIQFGEGRDNVRRQQRAADLAAAHDDPAALARVLDALVAARLLTAGSNPAGERTYDLAHEALLVGWARLAGWAKERAEAEKARRRLEEKAAEWLRLGAGEGGLLDAAELAEANAFLRSPDAADLGLSEALERHIAASRHALNPGWQLRGALLLAGAALALALMAGVGVNALLGSALQGSAVVTIGVAAVMLALVTLVALWLLRRADRFVMQRWSHALAARRRRGLAVAGLIAAALAVPGGVTYQRSALEQECAGYGLNPNAGSLVAVLLAEPDPTMSRSDAALFAERIQYWSDSTAHGVLVTDAQAERCARFVTLEARLRSEPLPAGDSTPAQRTLIVDLRRPREAEALAPVQRASDASCDTLLVLPQEVLSRAGLLRPAPGNPSLTEGSIPCRAAIAYVDAQRLMRIGADDVAEQRLREAIAADSRYADAYADLAVVLNRLGKYGEAIATVQAALEITTGQENAAAARVFLHTLLAGPCYRAGDWACAEQSWKLVIEQAENARWVAQAHNGLHLLYRRGGDLENARRELGEFAAWVNRGQGVKQENWITLQRNLGILAYLQGDWAQAIAALQAADKLQSPTWRELAGMWLAGQNLREARLAFAAANRRLDEEITYYLAAATQETGDASAACALWQRYQTIPASRLQGEAERRQAAQRALQLGCR